MPSNDPSSISNLNSSTLPITSPLSDRGRQEDVSLENPSDLASTEEDISPSTVTIDPPIPELTAAYNRTFLQITPPSIPKKEILAQLQPFSKSAASDFNNFIQESEAEISTDILNIIEKALKEEANNLQHYGPTGIDAAVTKETSPIGSQGLQEQDALLHSMSSIATTALSTPSSSTKNTTTRKNFSLAPSRQSSSIPSSSPRGSQRATKNTTPSLLDLTELQSFKQSHQAPSTNQTPPSTNGNSYNGSSETEESQQISNELLNAEEENSFNNVSGLERMITRDENSLIRIQSHFDSSLHSSLMTSLNTLKELINSPPGASTAIEA